MKKDKMDEWIEKAQTTTIKWVAIDKDGQVYGYTKKPQRLPLYWESRDYGDGIKLGVSRDRELVTKWDESLRKVEHGNEELKPCPFCGGEAEILQRGAMSTSIRCKDCGCRTGECAYEDAAIFNWNRRVCVSQSGEKLDINSEKPNLTYSDLEKMVKPLKWEFPDDTAYGKIGEKVLFICFRQRGYQEREMRVNWYFTPFESRYDEGLHMGEEIIFNADDAKKSVDSIRRRSRQVLVNLIADALGVERSGK